MSRRLRSVPAAPERTPERPGPGPVPPAVLRSLDLAIMRRVESLVPGEHLTPQVGGGTDLAMIRPYRPGDDVRHIDWNVTARMHEPHVRVHVGERGLTAWLLLDVSASMTFGTADRRKADVAEGVALAIGHVATRRGNRLGVLSFGGGRAARAASPRQGRVGLLGLLAELRHEPGGDGAGSTSIGDAVSRVAALARARGLVVIVSDFRGPRDWEGPLRALHGRHGVLTVEIRDPREQELTAMGDLWVMDAETGRQVQVNTSRKKVRERFARAAAEEREDVARALRRAGADHLVLSTEGDWLRDLAGHLRRGEAALRAGAPDARGGGGPLTGGAARPRGGARPAGAGGMSFAEPAILLGLVLVPLALLVYVAMQRRRVREAVDVRQPGADAEPGHGAARAGGATSRRCCWPPRWPRWSSRSPARSARSPRPSGRRR